MNRFKRFKHCLGSRIVASALGMMTVLALVFLSPGLAVAAPQCTPGCQSQIDALAARVAQLESLLQHFSRAGDQITISGANLHVVNGMGATSTTNSLGNVIIGYNELRGTGDDRSGSHMLVTGVNNNYTQFGGMVVGEHSTASGPFSSVSGGWNNTASGDHSSVSGGNNNTASGPRASVSGGNNGKALGYQCSVSGGDSNTADGIGSWVGGGDAGLATGSQGSVSGGRLNFADGDNSSVSGGNANSASGSECSVSGGKGNTASGDHSSISGGNGATVSGPDDWRAGSSCPALFCDM